ncbi:MAG: hypothetical protein JEZ04_20560 [Spirochaetales bacterium]|nr:hypothetical protein [Spirochaetales bacterium]
MIIGENVSHQKIVADISVKELNRIKDFIRGAVYCWCKNNTDSKGQSSWFTTSDLFGGMSADRSGTPLQALVDWHFNNGVENHELRALKDLRFILMKVIAEDLRRSYHTGHNEKGRRNYQWTRIDSRKSNTF